MFTPPDEALLIEPELLPIRREAVLRFDLGAFFFRAPPAGPIGAADAAFGASVACGAVVLATGGGAGAAASSGGSGAGLGALGRLGDEHIIFNPHYL
jgi:hypothetical protein